MPSVEFGADGIRGLVDQWPLIPSAAVQIGYALGRFVCQGSDYPCVVIGRDTRPSGAALSNNLIAGLTGQGVNVIDLGIMTTPGVAFIARRLQAGLGIVVSASHSTFEYNGIKLVGSNGLRLQREEEIEIEHLIEASTANAIDLVACPGQQADGQHLIEFYVNDHVQRCPAPSLEGLKVVLDCADGAASRVAAAVFERLGAGVVVINAAVDGRSINHHCGSEYAREHPQYLAGIVRHHHAAYGFAFDGDGDRLVVVDADGRACDGNDLLFVLAMHYHSRGQLRGNAVVTSLLTNRGLEEALRRMGVYTIYTNNGDKHLEAAIWGGDYLLGAEPGGNILINDGYHTAADAVYAALVLGGVLVCNPGLDLNAMAAPLQKRPQVITSEKFNSALPLERRAALQERIKRQEAELGEGGRILFWDSSTEPGLFRVMVEGGHENTLAEVSHLAEVVCQMIQQAASLAD